MDFIIAAQHLSIRTDQKRGIKIMLALLGNGTDQDRGVQAGGGGLDLTG